MTAATIKSSITNIERRKFLVGALCGSAAAVAFIRRPHIKLDYLGDEKLDELIPKRIGSWDYITTSGLVVPPDDPLEKLIYAQVLTRVYSDGVTPPIMLLIAQNNSQTGFLQIHRPEVCYAASGYQISATRPHLIAANGIDIQANSMEAVNRERIEHVLYWTRVGNRIPATWRDQKLAVAEQNLAGVLPDAILVRVSTIGNDPAASLANMDRFVVAMLGSVAPEKRSVLV